MTDPKPTSPEPEKEKTAGVEKPQEAPAPSESLPKNLRKEILAKTNQYLATLEGHAKNNLDAARRHHATPQEIATLNAEHEEFKQKIIDIENRTVNYLDHLVAAGKSLDKTVIENLPREIEEEMFAAIFAPQAELPNPAAKPVAQESPNLPPVAPDDLAPEDRRKILKELNIRPAENTILDLEDTHEVEPISDAELISESPKGRIEVTLDQKLRDQFTEQKNGLDQFIGDASIPIESKMPKIYRSTILAELLANRDAHNLALLKQLRENVVYVPFVKDNEFNKIFAHVKKDVEAATERAKNALVTPSEAAAARAAANKAFGTSPRKNQQSELKGQRAQSMNETRDLLTRTQERWFGTEGVIARSNRKSREEGLESRTDMILKTLEGQRELYDEASIALERTTAHLEELNKDITIKKTALAGLENIRNRGVVFTNEELEQLKAYQEDVRELESQYEETLRDVKTYTDTSGRYRDRIEQLVGNGERLIEIVMREYNERLIPLQEKSRELGRTLDELHAEHEKLDAERVRIENDINKRYARSSDASIKRRMLTETRVVEAGLADVAQQIKSIRDIKVSVDQRIESINKTPHSETRLDALKKRLDVLQNGKKAVQEKLPVMVTAAKVPATVERYLSSVYGDKFNSAAFEAARIDPRWVDKYGDELKNPKIPRGVFRSFLNDLMVDLFNYNGASQEQNRTNLNRRISIIDRLFK